MKKRNKPIVLTTALILMLGVVAFFNFPRDLFAAGHGPNDGHGHGEAPPTGQDVDVPDKSSVAKTVADSLKGKPQPGKPPVMDGAGGPAGPVIAVKKSGTYKPMPSDSSTSQQWYTDETPKELPKNK